MATAGDIAPTSGSKVYIGTQAANALTDSYTEVAEVTNIGEFGPEYEEITYSNLSNRNVRKFKGQRNDGSMQLDLGHAGSAVDAGQAAIKTAVAQDGAYNFKVMLNDDSEVSGATPTTFYFKARVMSYRRVPGGVSGVVAARTNLGIESGTIVEVGPS